MVKEGLMFRRSMSFLKPAVSALFLLSATAILGSGLLASGDAASAATAYKVNVGGGGRGIAVEEFMPGDLTVQQGDTIQFLNPYEEIHTVTYVAGGPVPALIVPAPGAAPSAGPPKLIFNPPVAFPTNEATSLFFDGSQYANSGIIGKGESWNVTFTTQGAFAFLCVLHPGMEASVKVVDTNTEATAPAKAEFDAAARLTETLEAGERSAARAMPGKATAAGGATTWEVLNAPSAGQADVMRFIPQRLQVNAGDTVLWKNDTPVPHTITFGGSPELVLPEPQAGGPPWLVLNPQVLFPVKPSQNYGDSGYANSGFIGTGPESTAGSSFSLTFTTPGTYLYVCVLHADQGMAGVVEVVGSATGGGTVRPPATGDAGLVASDEATAPWVALALLAPFGLAAFLVSRRLLARG
ncbi:MAG: hypothetical protein GEU75_02075 [Dehalococcoidia bacterium]|nr:hypothetical protein [Dehalococcoidia bacterium]